MNISMKKAQKSRSISQR